MNENCMKIFSLFITGLIVPPKNENVSYILRKDTNEITSYNNRTSLINNFIKK